MFIEILGRFSVSHTVEDCVWDLRAIVVNYEVSFIRCQSFNYLNIFTYKTVKPFAFKNLLPLLSDVYVLLVVGLSIKC